MDRITGTLSGINGILGSLSSIVEVSGNISIPETISPERYDGAYTFTPSGETQEIQIGGMMASQNIVIEPVPSNYGLVTWDGSTLTVS